MGVSYILCDCIGFEEDDLELNKYQQDHVDQYFERHVIQNKVYCLKMFRTQEILTSPIFIKELDYIKKYETPSGNIEIDFETDANFISREFYQDKEDYEDDYNRIFESNYINKNLNTRSYDFIDYMENEQHFSFDLEKACSVFDDDQMCEMMHYKVGIFSY